MNHITQQITARRSVRTYDGRPLDEGLKAKLLSFMDRSQNPLHIPVELKFLETKTHGLSCPVVSGTDLYVGGKIKSVPGANLAFGYSFEAFILYAQSLGLGTVWLGGTMNRTAFEQGMELDEDEMMPCASALGFPAKKPSVRENMMRMAIKANERLPFEELFFDGSFHRPLSKESAGSLALPLEMVRLAPSAVNRQPWRVVVQDHAVHFYLKRSKGVRSDGKIDMQMVDMGIALCHFALTAEELGINIAFTQEDPLLASSGLIYVASYHIAK